MAFSRRDLLKLALVGAAHPLLPLRGVVSQAFAAPGAADAKFLLVFLRGGYDAVNVVIPVHSDFYYEARPSIALPRPDPANPNAVLSLARAGNAVDWGLHPALKDSMLPFWQKGQLAFVPFAGTEDLTRSHFETQDSIESGLPVSQPGRLPPCVWIGISQSSGRRARRQRRTGGLYRRSSHGHERRCDGPERLAQRYGPCAV